MLTDYERNKVANEAIRKAEILNQLNQRTWYVEARVGAGNYGGDSVRFIDDRRSTDGGYNNEPVETFIATLMYERDEWKRRALKHGCQESGDEDCG